MYMYMYMCHIQVKRLPWVCCVALPCCLFDLACFFYSFLLSSLIKTGTCHKRSLIYPQFSRLGIQVSLAIYFYFVWAMVGWITSPFFSFLSTFLGKLASVLCTCTCIFIYKVTALGVLCCFTLFVCLLLSSFLLSSLIKTCVYLHVRT